MVFWDWYWCCAQPGDRVYSTRNKRINLSRTGCTAPDETGYVSLWIDTSSEYGGETAVLQPIDRPPVGKVAHLDHHNPKVKSRIFPPCCRGVRVFGCLFYSRPRNKTTKKTGDKASLQAKGAPTGTCCRRGKPSTQQPTRFQSCR